MIGGRINSDQEQRADALANLPNVSLLGPVPFKDGQALIESFSVGLIPFEEGSVGDAINPVKMYTYLERGVPVATTDIRECRGLLPHVRAGRGRKASWTR